MNLNRVRQLNNFQIGKNTGPILYWMQRDHRVEDNWAIIHGIELANLHNTSLEIVVCFNQDLSKHSITRRTFDFMIEGLVEVENKANSLGIGFNFLIGKPSTQIPNWINEHQAGILVCDFSPLKPHRKWRSEIADQIQIPMVEVDAHNIVPCWIASPHQEFAARTFRPKINKLLAEYLTNFPKVIAPKVKKTLLEFDWDLIKNSIKVDESVSKKDIIGGSNAAKKTLKSFLNRYLSGYASKHSNPDLNHLSNLSPYLHFGHISAQQIAWQIKNISIYNNHEFKNDKDTFLEELIIRRELADNFCYNNQAYSEFSSFPNWAKLSLTKHLTDKREFVYSLSEFEGAMTHDPAWNAAQIEMVITGKMHGYMRMYWAKKILEWSASPQESLKIAIYLNNKYEFDGRDANGYTGIAWSIGGVHDRPWRERDVFGMVRYMNFNGLSRKFNIDAYISKIKSLSENS